MEEYVITNPVQRTIWAYKPGWESYGPPWVRWETIGMTRRIRSGGKSPRDPKTGRLLLRENAYTADIWHEAHGLSNVETSFLTGQSGWRNVMLPNAGTVKDRAIFAWYKEAADVRMNLAVSLAERAQTAEMLGFAAMRVSGAMRAVKRGMLGEAIRELARGQQVVRDWAVHNGHSKALGRHFVRPTSKLTDGRKQRPEDVWMEANYGWRPFYNDVYGALISAQDNFTLPVKPIRKTKRQSTPFESQSSRSHEWVTTTKGHMVAQATVNARVRMVNDLHHRLQTLGLTNPALLAWDILPFSFMIDWFLPVNSWLEAQSALCGLEVESASLTTTTRWVYTQETVPNSTEFLSGTTPHKGQGARTLKVRTLGLPDIPSLRLNTPQEFGQAITTLAVARQLGFGKSNSSENKGFGRSPKIDPDWGDPTAIARKLAERNRIRRNTYRKTEGSLGP